MLKQNLSKSIDLCQLSSDDTRDIFGGVRVGEEPRRICFNLSQREARSSIHAIVQNTSNERSSQASNRPANDRGIIADWKWIGKSQSWGSGGSLWSFVNVGGRYRRRLIISSNTE